MQRKSMVCDPSVQAMIEVTQLRAHIALHHPERGPAQLWIDVSDRVRRHPDLEMTDVGVQRGVRHALLVPPTGDPPSSRPQPTEQIPQRCAVEAAMADLRQKPVL